MGPAISACWIAARLNPSSANVLDNRGLANLKPGELDHSIADYNEALKINPRLATWLYGREWRSDREQVGGEVDVAAAAAIEPNIADEFAR
jgi:tetratricopeptide (TPR) repeat protein